MAQSSIVATLSRQVFKRNITSILFAHSSSSVRSSSSLFFNRKIHLSASLSSQTTAMGDTPVAVDAGMDAVQRRLMFDDECILVDENDRAVGHESKYNSVILLRWDWILSLITTLHKSPTPTIKPTL
ncbi:isopentenyl-diphosphate delta-isomerase I-like protein [Trifolium pratense]|uniref:Isopentenyl-diphosphate delta-isomerase I-like protein n=1 Tax=Trifolium pratense TaxID=57577 RepID=A0A2K3LWQ3_TRIPR|nr:isopentenyl-diphosphate delta-isomerase I-like protein [Trifolium pratense]